LRAGRFPLPASTKTRKSPNLRGIKHLSRPDQWAVDLGLKVDGRTYSLEGREYVIQVIRDTHDHIVVKKAAQMAFTILFLVRTLHWITVRKWHHLYLLPLKTGAIPFVQSRIDPIIDSSSSLQTQFASVDNRLHKQTVEAVKLLVRGTNIESELQEIPVDVEVWDERDRMNETNLEDARHRMDGSAVKKLAELSTPTVPGHGVDSDDAWHNSDQHLWEISCPGCGRYQVLNFEESLRIGQSEFDCALLCTHCKRAFSDVDRAQANKTGRWVPYNLDGRLRGYHISQFNSSTMTLEEIMKGWFKGQKDARKLKSFFNQALGEPYVAEGDQLTPELLDKCIAEGYQMGGIPYGPLCIGVDVGNVLHVKVDVLDRFERRCLYAMRIFSDVDGNAWEQLDRYLSHFTSFIAVIDAHPEKRAARDLSIRYPGKVWLGFELDRPQTQEVAVWNTLKYGEAGKCIIDRTMAFDSVIHQVMHGNYVLPKHARELGEEMPRLAYNGFYHQMCQQVREEVEDTKGRLVARWRRNKNPDHWHHADMFAFIASLRTPTLVVPTNFGNAMRKAGSLVR
jgi:Phage terminase large subunit gpA, ATPase domain/Terminase large subunit gpA, endonuclease domain